MPERNTPYKDGELIAVPLAAVAVEAGKMAVINAAGYGEEGQVANDITYFGRYEESVDNSGGAAGDLSANVRRLKAFKWANSDSDAVTQASLGQTVYIEDDETVSATDDTGARSAAGICIQLDSDGVWVE